MAFFNALQITALLISGPYLLNFLSQQHFFLQSIAIGVAWIFYSILIIMNIVALEAVFSGKK